MVSLSGVVWCGVVCADTFPAQKIKSGWRGLMLFRHWSSNCPQITGPYSKESLSSSPKSMTIETKTQWTLLSSQSVRLNLPLLTSTHLSPYLLVFGGIIFKPPEATHDIVMKRMLQCQIVQYFMLNYEELFWVCNLVALLKSFLFFFQIPF